jgi:hypothetical protein
VHAGAHQRELDRIVQRLRSVAASDDVTTMADALDEFAKVSDPRVRKPWHQLGVCLAARRKELKKEQELAELEAELQAERAHAREAAARRAAREKEKDASWMFAQPQRPPRPRRQHRPPPPPPPSSVGQDSRASWFSI